MGDLPTPFDSKRMKPQRNRAKEGRANPKGIPYLYAATHRETAIAEVRPWTGACVSIASLSVVRSLTLMSCTSQSADSFLFYFKEPGPVEKADANWQIIDEAFSRPVTPNDHLADYVPTQVLAESFRQHGFDGVAYRSSLGPAHIGPESNINIVLFDLDAVEIVDRSLCTVKSVAIVTEDA